jgi:hypothetical protein
MVPEPNIPGKEDQLCWLHFVATHSDSHEFFSFGVFERNLYISPMPVDLQEVYDRIVNVVPLVNVTFLNKLWNRLEYCLDIFFINRGSHIEHL